MGPASFTRGGPVASNSKLFGEAKETRTMNERRFPKEWNEERVKRLIAELDARTDEEWIAADEAAAAEGEDKVVITVPAALLPETRRLLSSHKSA
jgi:hypothetical protein